MSAYTALHLLRSMAPLELPTPEADPVAALNRLPLVRRMRELSPARE